MPTYTANYLRIEHIMTELTCDAENEEEARDYFNAMIENEPFEDYKHPDSVLAEHFIQDITKIEDK